MIFAYPGADEAAIAWERPPCVGHLRILQTRKLTVVLLQLDRQRTVCQFNPNCQIFLINSLLYDEEVKVDQLQKKSILYSCCW
jgi:hypothetical protein